MAEIHVEKKRGSGGKLWLLLLVIILIAAAVWAWQAGYLGGTASASTFESPVFAALSQGGANGA